MYHYIATGTTLEAHFYRIKGDPQTVESIQKFIDEKLNSAQVYLPNQSMFEDDSAILLVSQDEPLDDMDIGVEDVVDDEGDSESDDDERETAKELFSRALENYKNTIFMATDSNPSDSGMVKAMRAAAKTMNKSAQCNPLTLQSRLHNFGKGTAAARKTKTSHLINQPSQGD